MPSVKCRGTKIYTTVLLRELEAGGVFRGLNKASTFD
jgi:hypothetical protein